MERLEAVEYLGALAIERVEICRRAKPGRQSRARWKEIEQEACSDISRTTEAEGEAIGSMAMMLATENNASGNRG